MNRCDDQEGRGKKPFHGSISSQVAPTRLGYVYPDFGLRVTEFPSALNDGDATAGAFVIVDFRSHGAKTFAHAASPRVFRRLK
jgi:hypothetical protein